MTFEPSLTWTCPSDTPKSRRVTFTVSTARSLLVIFFFATLAVMVDDSFATDSAALVHDSRLLAALRGGHPHVHGQTCVPGADDVGVLGLLGDRRDRSTNHW